ncbi:hypothetical protein EDD15DRAFT_2246992 [Pisolithus albus]|nr:hypothetical protein EDD15DRAFT_2246992 [Pisolithus albus]
MRRHPRALLMDPSPVVKRAVLHNTNSLCIFLGRQKTNDVRTTTPTYHQLPPCSLPSLSEGVVGPAQGAGTPTEWHGNLQEEEHAARTVRLRADRYSQDLLEHLPKSLSLLDIRERITRVSEAVLEKLRVLEEHQQN